MVIETFPLDIAINKSNYIFYAPVQATSFYSKGY